jgi:hypothetical protein
MLPCREAGGAEVDRALNIGPIQIGGPPRLLGICRNRQGNRMMGSKLQLSLAESVGLLTKSHFEIQG